MTVNDDVLVRLLGPVEAGTAGISGLRRKAVLAVLALHPGEIVSAERLIDIVWDQSPPATAANTLQSHVSHLRGVLGATVPIVSAPPGYRLDIPATATDLGAAERLIRRGRQTTDPVVAAEALRAALALWRGTALADVTGMTWLYEQAERIENLRSEAIHALIDARLALGEHAQLVDELQRLAEEHPFREHTHRQLMLALYRDGRQAEALAAYQNLRRNLLDELGIDPSPDVRDLEAAILRQDASLRPAITAAPTPAAVPAQLPFTLAAFSGRAAELARLDAIHSTGIATIVTVSGTAGVGKTALAVHWAHRVAAAFPDGQLYINLRGFHPSASFVSPSVAIRAFLEAFGIPADQVPAGADAQASLYRSVLAGRRVLIVVDNARDADQVRPLLPGEPGCFVLVTSRSQLGGLVAAEGAHPLVLRLPSSDEAHDMFARRIGPDRVAADPATVDEIIDQCARLPLALAVTAARIALRPELPLSVLAAELRDSPAGLDPFRGDDTATDVRAVFSWSYRTLSPEAARMFRAISLAPGLDGAIDVAASLVGLPTREARDHLDELARGHLITERQPGRFCAHDLLCTYADELTAQIDGDHERFTAQRRMVEHYLHTAYAATMLLTPNRHPITLPPIGPGVTVTELADVDAALAWFAAEQTALLAIVGADIKEFDEQVWQLAWTLTTYLERRGYWRENIASQEAGLRAAIRCGDLLGQAYAHRNLGNTDTRIGCYTDATRHFEEALRLFAECGEEIVVAHTHLGVAWVHERQGQQAEALASTERAMVAYRSVDHRVGLASALNTAGHCHNALGDYERGEACCVEALGIFRELGDRSGEGGTLDSLGYLYFRLGDPQRAASAYRDSIMVYRDLGDRYSMGEVFMNLGDGYAKVGDAEAAGDAWRAAVNLFDELDHPAAEMVRAKLGLAPLA